MRGLDWCPCEAKIVPITSVCYLKSDNCSKVHWQFMGVDPLREKTLLEDFKQELLALAGIQR
jgi:hypothetical protein